MMPHRLQRKGVYGVKEVRAAAGSSEAAGLFQLCAVGCNNVCAQRIQEPREGEGRRGEWSGAGWSGPAVAGDCSHAVHAGQHPAWRATAEHAQPERWRGGGALVVLCAPCRAAACGAVPCRAARACLAFPGSRRDPRVCRRLQTARCIPGSAKLPRHALLWVWVVMQVKT
eukprot:27543-Chlamydomonas_euryale.AAC.3